MSHSLITAAAIFIVGAIAQTTYTGCHMHGSISYCFNSNGVELAMTTLTSAVSTVTAPASVAASTTAAARATAVTSCHLHDSDIFCIDGAGDEVSVSIPGSATSPVPAAYTACHSHGSEQFCVDPQGNDVAVFETSESGHNHTDGEEASEGELSCHFHAGVE